MNLQIKVLLPEAPTRGGESAQPSAEQMIRHSPAAGGSIDN